MSPAAISGVPMPRPDDPMSDPRDENRPLAINEFGTPVSVHICSSCGDEFTVCPPAGSEFGDGCLAPLCPSYDIERDVDYLLAMGCRIRRGGGTDA